MLSIELKSKINWFNIDLAAQADFANDFPPQQEEIGYETRNIMYNMEFMFYILMFQNVRLIVSLFLKKIITYFNIESPWLLKFYGFVSDKLLY